MSANLFRAISYLEGIEPTTPVRPEARSAPGNPTIRRVDDVVSPRPARILVVFDPAGDVNRALSLARAVARDAGGTVRVLAVHPVPEPIRDPFGRIRVTSERLIDRLEARTLDELRRLAARQLDGVASTTAVIFGDAGVEIARDAQAFGADLVVFAAEPRHAWPSMLRRLA